MGTSCQWLLESSAVNAAVTCPAFQLQTRSLHHRHLHNKHTLSICVMYSALLSRIWLLCPNSLLKCISFLLLTTRAVMWDLCASLQQCTWVFILTSAYPGACLRLYSNHPWRSSRAAALHRCRYAYKPKSNKHQQQQSSIHTTTVYGVC